MALTTVRPEGMGFNTGRRNMVINGAMQVAQRGTSTSLVHDGTISNFSPDRFQFQLNNTLDELEGTLAQVTDSPDGFSNSLKWTTTEPEGAIDADHYVSLFQKIEGQNLQHIKNGSSGALSLTLSFYVKSSQTGTFGVNLYKDDSTSRIINSTYTIASANTWEYKTITFAGDTSGGGINNDNGIGFYCSWHLAAGSNFDSVNSTSWANYSTTNWAGGHAQDGVITTDNATWQITGIQLEVGSNASDFEHRSFGEELALCQRYYHDFFLAASNNFWLHPITATGSTHWRRGSFTLPTAMRADPTVTLTADTNGSFLSGSPTVEGDNHSHYVGVVGDVAASGTYAFLTMLKVDAEL